MKFKTLKDIEFNSSYDYYNPKLGSRKIIESKDLKKEAIKWIKANQETIGNENATSWIKYFFNITEDDLK